jgi:hypothetical protein
VHVIQKGWSFLYLVNNNPGARLKRIHLSTKLSLAGEEWNEFLIEEEINPKLGL